MAIPHHVGSASFVAKDGSILERKLIEKESNNPNFSFLMDDKEDYIAEKGIEIAEEQIFYRWRVYAFTQGDGFDSWRTEPFIMIQPFGRFWIPPSLDQEAARKEEAAAKQKEEEILAKMEHRRKISEKKDFMTGRQLEHAKFGGGAGTTAEGAAKLNDYEMEQFSGLLNNVCASREAICEAMAFCFDKSGAAKQISDLLKDTLLDDRLFVSVDTRIARLFLLSDVLFNSQQPGVRNAFRYRDAIETMAPEVFESLGKHEQGKAGRMTMNKLRNVVSAVLSAWTNWSVYNPTFLDELYARFEGKEVVSNLEGNDNVSEVQEDTKIHEKKIENDLTPSIETNEDPAEKPRGGWTLVGAEESDGHLIENVENVDVDGEELVDGDVDGEVIEEESHDGEPLDDVDGEALDPEADGEPLENHML